jgi:hypothetical protein
MDDVAKEERIGEFELFWIAEIERESEPATKRTEGG